MFQAAPFFFLLSGWKDWIWTRPASGSPTFEFEPSSFTSSLASVLLGDR